MDFDRRLTLAELAGDDWCAPGSDATGVHKELDQLRHVALRLLNREDLRLLVTHHVGLEYAVPLAIEEVEADPLVLALIFHGDLLTSLLRVDPSFWEDHVDLRDRVSAVLDSLRELPSGTEPAIVAAAETFPG